MFIIYLPSTASDKEPEVFFFFGGYGIRDRTVGSQRATNQVL